MDLFSLDERHASWAASHLDSQADRSLVHWALVLAVLTRQALFADWQDATAPEGDGAAEEVLLETAALAATAKPRVATAKNFMLKEVDVFGLVKRVKWFELVCMKDRLEDA